MNVAILTSRKTQRKRNTNELAPILKRTDPVGNNSHYSTKPFFRRQLIMPLKPRVTVVLFRFFTNKNLLNRPNLIDCTTNLVFFSRFHLWASKERTSFSLKCWRRFHVLGFHVRLTRDFLRRRTSKVRNPR